MGFAIHFGLGICQIGGIDVQKSLVHFEIIIFENVRCLWECIWYHFEQSPDLNECLSPDLAVGIGPETPK